MAAAMDIEPMCLLDRIKHTLCASGEHKAKDLAKKLQVSTKKINQTLYAPENLNRHWKLIGNATWMAITDPTTPGVGSPSPSVDTPMAEVHWPGGPGGAPQISEDGKRTHMLIREGGEHAKCWFRFINDAPIRRVHQDDTDIPSFMQIRVSANETSCHYRIFFIDTSVEIDTHTAKCMLVEQFDTIPQCYAFYHQAHSKLHGKGPWLRKVDGLKNEGKWQEPIAVTHPWIRKTSMTPKVKMAECMFAVVDREGTLIDVYTL